jgi:hypothetical protein
MIRNAQDAEAAVMGWLAENGGSFRYTVVSSRREQRRWIVMLDVFTGDGHLIDGPYLLAVDSDTGEVSTTYP